MNDQQMQTSKSLTATNAKDVQQAKNDIGQFLDKYKTELAKALPKHLTPDRVLRIALTEIRRNPRLLECNRISLLAAIIQSGQLGLIPDSLTGQAYLIPFGQECQFIIGYKGMMRLAYNSAQVLSISSNVVYKGDIFEYENGLKPILRHVPSTKAKRTDDDIEYAYAIASLKTGGMAYVVLPREEILWHMSFSAALKNPKRAKYSPWTTAFPEMAKKTAIRALCKYLPASADDLTLEKAVALDEIAGKNSQHNDEVFGDISFEESELQKKDFADEVAESINTEVQNG